MPSAAPECLRQLEDAGLNHRAAFIGGDFFRGLPAGHDLYILKSVLHNWDDAAAGRLLAVCRQAISPEGRLLIMERVIAEGKSSVDAKLFDINMLVIVGGRERTEQEYTNLLSGANFAVTRVLPTASPLSIIEAAPQY
jgi:hypothetical protein